MNPLLCRHTNKLETPPLPYEDAHLPIEVSPDTQRMNWLEKYWREGLDWLDEQPRDKTLRQTIDAAQGLSASEAPSTLPRENQNNLSPLQDRHYNEDKQPTNRK